jgi:hypothetical protein
MQLPACVLERLEAGEPMAPSLRELVKPDGRRVAVLDVIVQVKPPALADWSQVERVLGFDWGVHTLITATVLQHNPADPEHPIQISRPLFLNTGGLDGHQARTRRQIDQLRAVRDRLAADDPKRALYQEEMRRCWWLYVPTWHTARCRCFRRTQIPVASWKEASFTSMAGRDPSPCARRMPPRCCFDCVAERGGSLTPVVEKGNGIMSVFAPLQYKTE